MEETRDMSLKYADEYSRKFTFAEEAVKVIKSGDRVIYAFGVCSVNELDRALAARKNELQEVKVICNDISCRYYAMDSDISGNHFKFYEGICPGARESVRHEGGTINTDKPLTRKYLKGGNSTGHIFMATVSPMDKNGHFWFGCSKSQKHNFRQYYEMAEYVILEINERILEGCKDQESIHISQVDKIVGSNNEELLPSHIQPRKYYLFEGNIIENKNRAV
jgi:acyl-CoA hydrolase